MKFFINDAILRKECSEIKKIGNHEIELVIHNYLEDKGKYEDIKFTYADNYIAKLEGKYGIVNVAGQTKLKNVRATYVDE